MPFDPEIQMKKHIVEAWGLWYVQWQTQKKEQLRRHSMSTQVRLKEFEKHLKSSSDQEQQQASPCSTLTD